MPRKPHFNLIGVPQHVIQRGNNREPKKPGSEHHQIKGDRLRFSLALELIAI